MQCYFCKYFKRLQSNTLDLTRETQILAISLTGQVCRGALIASNEE